MPCPVRRAAAVAALLTVTLAAPATAQEPSTPTPDPSPATTADLLALVGADRIPLHHVIMVDTSRAMTRSDLEQIKAGLEAFATSLPAGDRYTVCSFSAAPVAECEVNAAAPGEMDGLDGLPTSPGPDPDLGMAIGGALEVVEGSDGAPTFVVLLSSGRHRPGPSSTFGLQVDQQGTDQAWRPLRDRARALMRGDDPRLVDVLGLAAGDDADLRESLRRVFPENERWSVAPMSDLEDDLQTLLERADGARAGHVLRTDLLAPVQASFSDPQRGQPGQGNGEIGIRLRSTATHLPLSITGFEVVPGGSRSGEAEPDTVALQPGETATITVRAAAGTGTTGQPDPSNTPAATGQLKLRGQVGTPWADALTDAGLGDRLPPELTLAVAPFEHPPGTDDEAPPLSSWDLLVVGAALGGLLAVAFRFRRRPALPTPPERPPYPFLDPPPEARSDD